LNDRKPRRYFHRNRDTTTPDGRDLLMVRLRALSVAPSGLLAVSQRKTGSHLGPPLGDLDAGVDSDRVWMACDCGPRLVRPLDKPTKGK